MIHQSVGRNQKSEGFKVKHVFQITLLLVICIWSFYVIKNSNNKWIEKIVSDGSVDLGRKGNAGSNDGGVIVQQRNYNEGETEENELDRNAEEKAQEDSSQLEDVDEKVLDHGAKEEEKLEYQPKHTFDNENGKPTQSSDEDEAEENPEEKHDENDPKELQSSEENNAEVTSSDEESTYSAEEAETTNITGQRESISGVHDFHDENGIPPGDHENFATNETSVSLMPMTRDEKTVLEFDNQTELDTSTQTNNQNDSDMPSGSCVLGKRKTESDDSVEEDFNSENADKLNKSSINETVELIQEEKIYSEDSISDLSQDEVEEVEEA